MSCVVDWNCGVIEGMPSGVVGGQGTVCSWRVMCGRVRVPGRRGVCGRIMSCRCRVVSGCGVMCGHVMLRGCWMMCGCGVMRGLVMMCGCGVACRCRVMCGCGARCGLGKRGHQGSRSPLPRPVGLWQLRSGGTQVSRILCDLILSRSRNCEEAEGPGHHPGWLHGAVLGCCPASTEHLPPLPRPRTLLRRGRKRNGFWPPDQ